MTTEKPRWWQSWIVYVLVGLLVTIGPYVGGYFWLGRFHADHANPFNVRAFDYDILRIAFGPLGWAESKIRGRLTILSGPGGFDFYHSTW